MDSVIHLLSILDAYSKVRYYALTRHEKFVQSLGLPTQAEHGVGGMTPSLNLSLIRQLLFSKEVIYYKC